MPFKPSCGQHSILCQNFVFSNIWSNRLSSVYCLLAPGSCFWVAVLEGKVVGTVAAVGQQKESGGAVVLQRMSVDQRYRKCGVGVVLGRKVLEFAAHYGYSSVILGTTAYAPAAHRLYQRLGFCCVGVTNGYATPGGGHSLLEQIFYRVLHHHYRIDVQSISLKWTPTTVNAQMTKNEGNFWDW